MTKPLMRRIIVIGSILLAVIIYISYFDTTEDNMEIKLGQYLNDTSLDVVKTRNLNRQEEDKLIAYFVTDHSYGIALLYKGLNGKYVINDAHQSTTTSLDVTFIIDGMERTIGYRGTPKNVSEQKLPSNNSSDPILGSTWKSILVPLGCLIIIIFSVLVTRFLSKKYNKDSIGHYKNLPKDGQAMKMY